MADNIKEQLSAELQQLEQKENPTKKERERIAKLQKMLHDSGNRRSTLKL